MLLIFIIFVTLHATVFGSSIHNATITTSVPKTTDFLNKLKEDLRRNNDDYNDKDIENTEPKLQNNADQNLLMSNRRNLQDINDRNMNRKLTKGTKKLLANRKRSEHLNFENIKDSVLAIISNQTETEKVNELYEPTADELDMAPAKGGRIFNMRLKKRLCYRHVLLPEGPKYDSSGAIYVKPHSPNIGPFTQTKRPRLLLPKCCNCCKKSVLGCE